VTQLHAAFGPIVLVLGVVLAVAAGVLAARGRSPESVEWVRRVTLGIIVVGAAIGLALAVRGSGPAEAIHWVYGVVIVVLLMLPGSLRADMPPAQRSGALAVGASLAAVLAWRLGASG
jgi:hypothetical protein